MHRGLTLAVAGLLVGVQAHADDYPTGRGRLRVRLHGQQWPEPQALEKCACSIDVIASIIPYEYEAGETVLRMRQVRGGGEKMDLFRDTTIAKDAVDRLRRAQIEAELRCFRRVAH